MAKLIMLQGLPACGKTTWAMQQLTEGNYIRVSLKEIEEQMTEKNSKKKISNALKIRNDLLENIMKNRTSNIILDDYNLSIISQRAIEKLCQKYNYNFELKSFLDIPINECIKRDLKRENSVGPKRIQKLYNKYLAPTFQRNLELSWKKKRCIVFCLDSVPRLEPSYLFTLIIDSIKETYGDYYVDLIILSNEHEKRRIELVSWLEKHLINIENIIMKPDDNFSSASDFKISKMAELEKEYGVLGIFETDNTLASLWESKGYNVLRTRGISKG